MTNIYVAAAVEGFNSSADFNYVCEFVIDCIDDSRYSDDSRYTDGDGHESFSLDMMNFIYGTGQ